MSDSEDEHEFEADEVELGFVRRVQGAGDVPRLHADPDWSRWDGGKVGGRPSWLVPGETLPAVGRLQCSACQSPLTLLLQIYCPLDDEPDAFHRSLYIFCCREAGCSKQGDGQVLRAQLPQVNAFYSAESGATQRDTSVDVRKLCVLCGQRASLTCSACHVAQYCCKAHQKDHWSAGGHKTDCAECASTGKLIESDAAEERVRTKGTKWVFPEYELEIDHEPDASEAVDAHEAKLIADFEKAKAERQRAPAQGESDPFTDDSAIDVTQQELNDAIGAASGQDQQYVRFLTRVALAKDQVLRYARWQDESVLWVHSEGTRSAESVPPCSRCGGPRQFECQVLPQLLFYLQVDQQGSLSDISARSCDWGTLAVYTCTASCPLNGEYADEFLHYQPPYSGA